MNQHAARTGSAVVDLGSSRRYDPIQAEFDMLGRRFDAMDRRFDQLERALVEAESQRRAGLSRLLGNVVWALVGIFSVVVTVIEVLAWY